MIILGLTGGIGAGKSTVAELFAARGVTVIDADAIAREVTAPGTRGHDAVAAEFPHAVVDGVLDRSALARIVFTDDDARRRLEGIVHPLVYAESERRAAGHEIVLHDVPLITEKGRADRYDAVIVVGASQDVRRDRLIRRGMTDADITARIAAQASDSERRQIADFWIDNDGDRAALERQVAAIIERVSGSV
ncbi:MAG: dephospho-CoA kinase [Ruaniaceae bacterium]|nr:dephospho-CoA kinase [Ruaniaceae bacterium]